jgi:ribonuclease-3
VKKFLLTHVYSTLAHILEKALFVDPKSFLQEHTQAIWGITPQYQVVEEVGQDHNKLYIVSAILDDIVLGTGKGSSKKKAEQDAAENAVAVRAEWEGRITLSRKPGV